MKAFFRQPFVDVLSCLEHLVVSGRKRQSPTVLFVVLGALAVTWFVYVPIHELLHAGGCIWTGGDVTRLELSPRYGATWLKEIFPFISSGSDYAGQLTGFDTRGSDFCYFATVFLPFALTVLIGVPLIKLAGRARRPVLLGMAIVVGMAPFYNVPGDYFEMGSILTTRALSTVIGEEPRPVSEKAPPSQEAGSEETSTPRPVNPGTPETDTARADEVDEATPREPAMQAAYAGIRSDDIYRLIGTLIDEPSALGLTSPGRIAIGCLLIAISALVDVGLAFATYWLGHLFAGLILPRRRERT